jgi:signal transduction histidine kinase
MPGTPGAQLDLADVDSALLAVLIDATTAREGAAALLNAVAPALEDDDVHSMALAARDRDGISLNILAEQGAPRTWPATLEPRFAVGAQPGIDASTEALVVPLRSNGRVVGALLLGGTFSGTAPVRETVVSRLLGTVAATLEALLTRADDAVQRRATALRSVETVLEGMAHQMANPLTGASAIAQILAEEIEDDGQRAAVKQIRQELNRAFVVLQDLLNFQRSTGAHAGVLDLNTIVEETTRFRGYVIREQGITLDVELSASMAPVRAEASRVEHALLLGLQFAEQQSRGSVNRSVAVRVLERPTGDIEVEITDSGPGNVPELASTFYDVSFRESNVRLAVATDKPDLGLVASMLRGVGGRLEVRGSKASGTTLSLVLPKATASNSTPPGSR